MAHDRERESEQHRELDEDKGQGSEPLSKEPSKDLSKEQGKEKPFKFVVRLPLSLRNQVADAAKYYRRSMNSEIVARLEQSFSGLLTEPPPNQSQMEMVEINADLESIFGRSLSQEEEQIIRSFRRLPDHKQAALLELLT